MYTSNVRFCMRAIQPPMEEKKNKPSLRFPYNKHAGGSFEASELQERTFVIQRSVHHKQQRYIPSHLLFGLLPTVLLDHFVFWQATNEKDENMLFGTSTNPEQSAWNYDLEIKLNLLISEQSDQLPTLSSRYSATIIRKNKIPVSFSFVLLSLLE